MIDDLVKKENKVVDALQVGDIIIIIKETAEMA
jgi:hypothetical protein